MNPQKVLIITYYWPPSGGSGVQRWLKFAKYLDRAGWETIVYTPENPSFTIKDQSLIADVPSGTEVLRLPIWEPYEWFQRLSALFGKSKVAQSDFVTTANKSFFQKVTGWIRGNLFIPDPRVFWVRPSRIFLEDFIRSNQVTRIITTGPPHSVHLIGLKLKRRIPSLKWIADFRDPWSEWDLLDTLSLSSLARRRHRRLERNVLQEADRVITIAPFHVARFESLGERKVDLVTNGFDTEDFEGIQKQRTAKFTIRHIGVVDQLRDPRPFMTAIRELCQLDHTLQEKLLIEFIGAVNSAFKDEILRDKILGAVTRFVEPIPHRQLLEVYGQTDLQLLVLAHTLLGPGNLPGKFFEYLASGNPIIAIGPEGDASKILSETGAGKIFEPGNTAGIAASVKGYIQKWEKNEALVTGDTSGYTRKHLTDQLIKLLESL